jgi:hypothetical protein
VFDSWKYRALSDIEERAAWLDRSLSLDEAAESLGWHYRELNQVISGCLRPARSGRSRPR